jgi:uncharacterized membrane protein
MNPVQIHLGLNHFPIALSLTGLVMLIIAMMKNNDALTKTAFWLLIVSGISCLPVYFSGEGAEETVEHLAGISESAIEAHEELAKAALTACIINAALAMAGLFFYNGSARLFKILVLLTSLVSSATILQTAHKGGLIRHEELGGTSAATTGESMNAGEEKEKED